MRTAIFSVLLVLGISLSASAQTWRVEVTDGLFRDGMQPATTPYTAGATVGDRSVAIPAIAPKTTPDATPLVNAFRIRSWVEGDGVRVLVFAVTVANRNAPIRLVPDREEQIASIALKTGESFEVAETDKYNARRFTVKASTW
jgi:hypothetical protein